MVKSTQIQLFRSRPSILGQPPSTNTRNIMRLKDKVAVVTGASNGIGLAAVMSRKPMKRPAEPSE